MHGHGPWAPWAQGPGGPGPWARVHGPMGPWAQGLWPCIFTRNAHVLTCLECQEHGESYFLVTASLRSHFVVTVSLRSQFSVTASLRKSFFCDCFAEKLIIWGMNGVAVARHGLILWENEAASLRISFKCLPDQKYIYTKSRTCMKTCKQKNEQCKFSE